MLQRSPKISLRKKNLLLKRFVFKSTAKDAAKEAGVNRNTANLYFNHFREKIYDEYYRAPRFSGEVEIDQAFFGKGRNRKKNIDKKIDEYGDPEYWKKNFKKKRIYKRVESVMVLGILRRNGAVYTHIIKKADRNTLFSVIHLVVENGTTIYSDQWQGFNGLNEDGYIHKTVNHRKGLVSKDGVHTGGIDNFWGYAKQLLARFKGLSRRTFALHLKECEFRWNHKDEKEMLRILKKIIKI